MYRTICSFESHDGKTLSFRKDAILMLLDCTRDAHWWLMINDSSQLGYVPANYVAKANDICTDEVVKSIDRGIEFIHHAATKTGGNMSHGQRENLQKLIEHRAMVLTGQQLSSSQSQMSSKSSTGQQSIPRRASKKTRAAPAPPGPPSSGLQKAPSPPVQSQSATEIRTASAPVTSSPNQSQTPVTNTPIKVSPVSSPNKSGTPSFPVPDIPMGLITDIVEKIRSNTGLSFDKSKLAVRIVLESIQESVPELSDAMNAIIQKRASAVADTSTSSVVLNGGKDFERLEVIFSELANCKDDSQQRSWALHEDESIITEYLEELQTILTDADPRVCKAVIQKDDYQYLTSLVLYYQMEHRVALRLHLLKVFGGICGLDPNAVSQLLLSVLPVEVGRDMKTDRENFTKLCYSALICVMLFSTGEEFPFTHYDQLGSDFVHFLMDTIEQSPEDEDAEQLPDLFVKVLLAYNLHFQVPAENILMKVLAGNRVCKIFSEKIMLLVNREVDPVKILNHTSNVPNSLLKFLADIFSSRNTSDIFYTNDMMVLIDIMVRQITDLSAGDSIRTEYLSLIYSIFQNTDYWEHKHRLGDLEKAFYTISNEEDTAGDQDRYILKEIVKQFSGRFTCKF